VVNLWYTLPGHVRVPSPPKVVCGCDLPPGVRVTPGTFFLALFPKGLNGIRVLKTVSQKKANTHFLSSAPSP